jgi:hypothetical protein
MIPFFPEAAGCIEICSTVSGSHSSGEDEARESTSFWRSVSSCRPMSITVILTFSRRLKARAVPAAADPEPMMIAVLTQIFPSCVDASADAIPPAQRATLPQAFAGPSWGDCVNDAGSGVLINRYWLLPVVFFSWFSKPNSLADSGGPVTQRYRCVLFFLAEVANS